MTLEYLGWMDYAQCQGAELSDFFNPARYHVARKKCLACPVSDLCREWTDKIEGDTPQNHLFGLFGGESAAQRFKRRKKKRLPEPTYSDPRQRPTCVNGHRNTPDDWHIKPNGSAVCKPCRAQQSRDARRRTREHREGLVPTSR